MTPCCSDGRLSSKTASPGWDLTKQTPALMLAMQAVLLPPAQLLLRPVLPGTVGVLLAAASDRPQWLLPWTQID